MFSFQSKNRCPSQNSTFVTTLPVSRRDCSFISTDTMPWPKGVSWTWKDKQSWSRRECLQVGITKQRTQHIAKALEVYGSHYFNPVKSKPANTMIFPPPHFPDLAAWESWSLPSCLLRAVVCRSGVKGEMCQCTEVTPRLPSSCHTQKSFHCKTGRRLRIVSREWLTTFLMKQEIQALLLPQLQ